MQNLDLQKTSPTPPFVLSERKQFIFENKSKNDKNKLPKHIFASTIAIESPKAINKIE